MPLSRSSANSRTPGSRPRSDRGLLNAVRFAAVMVTAVAMSAGFAHLYELPNKIGLSQNDYRIVQQNYRGWHYLGFAVVGALILLLLLAFLERKRPAGCILALFAGLCIAVDLIVFFAYTFPANQATSNWTTMPENWEALRRQWEYSHAAGAGLYFLALASLTLSLLVNRE